MKSAQVNKKEGQEKWYCVPILREEMVMEVINARWMEETGDGRSVVEGGCRMV